jgi:TonB family protein
MNGEATSILADTSEPLTLPMVVSCGLHLALAVVLATGAFFPSPPAKPIINADQTIQVAMVALPKSNKAVPDKASRTPIPAGVPEPQPVPKPTPEPAERVLRTPEPPPQPRMGDTERADKMADLMRQLEMEAVIADLEAPIQRTNRKATSPDGTEDSTATSTGSGVPGDPEWVRYTQSIGELFRTNFHPLQAVVRANPDLTCTILVSINPSGAVTSFRITRSSGNPSFDRAAESAVETVGSLPLPPERFLAKIADGFTVNFESPS